MVTLTIFSVGYGEVHPIDTPWLRLLAMGRSSLAARE
jgi:voltage-gated potassium channel